MKNIKIIILAILVTTTNVSAQIVTVHSDVILFDSLSFFDLKEKGLIVDKVIHDGQILFLEFVDDGLKKQYYKSSDITYYFRSFSEGKLYEEGQCTLDTIHFGKIDTSFTFCIPEEMILEKSYLLLKSGKWKKYTSGGEKYFGNYINGKKEGTWIKVNYKNEKSQIEYSNNTIINLTNPYSYEVKGFLKEYRNLELIAQFDNSIELSNIIIVELKQSKRKDSNSYKFRLGEDDQISLTKQTIDGGSKPINGYYHYFTNTFNFKEEEINLKFKIIEIGKSKIILERIK